MAVAILAGCVTQLPVGRISDRMDRRTVAIVVCLMASLGATGAWWLADLSRLGFFTLVAAYGGLSLNLIWIRAHSVPSPPLHPPAETPLTF